jgi:hypothetical protein
MKKLLSLPPNLVGSFHEITGFDKDGWFCTSDPAGARLGSGGGTAWLLEACRKEEEDTARQAPEAGENPASQNGSQEGGDAVSRISRWLPKEKRILLHAGGQGRRLPAYAPSGKILTPVPVFRWARGQKLSQDLLSLQLPLYEKIRRHLRRSIP